MIKAPDYDLFDLFDGVIEERTMIIMSCLLV
jgi:hypothetical protein